MIEALNARATRILRNALLATTAMSVISILATHLWSAGLPQWSFAIAFCAVWGLITFSWSQNHSNEESGMLLAGIMDRNFQQLYRQLDSLEEKITLMENDLPKKETPAEGGL